jgi:putative transposase
MEKNNVVEFSSQEEILDPLTDLLQSGARQLIKQAVESEVEELLNQYSRQRTKDGKAGVGAITESGV